MELTINLPEPVFQQLRTLSELTNQPLDNLVLQSIAGNLPPGVEDVPAEMRSELLRMQVLSVEELRSIAAKQVDRSQRQIHFDLLEKNKKDSLTPNEQQQLDELTLSADQLMLKKAHACAILRWRGVPIRSLEQLSPA